MLEAGKTLAIFSVRGDKNGTVWVRAGFAEVNRDGSLNLHLDVLPIDGRLHIRESYERPSSGLPPLPH